MLQIKAGVVFKSIQEPALLLFKILIETSNLFSKDLTITSANDSKHMDTSRHYRDLAWDLRTRDLTPEQSETLFTKLATELGTAYDVVKESDHIHVEYDPKS